MTDQTSAMTTEQATKCYRLLEKLDTDARFRLDEMKTIFKLDEPSAKLLLRLQEWAFNNAIFFNRHIHEVMNTLEPYCDLPENGDHPF